MKITPCSDKTTYFLIMGFQMNVVSLWATRHISPSQVPTTFTFSNKTIMFSKYECHCKRRMDSQAWYTRSRWMMQGYPNTTSSVCDPFSRTTRQWRAEAESCEATISASSSSSWAGELWEFLPRQLCTWDSQWWMTVPMKWCSHTQSSSKSKSTFRPTLTTPCRTCLSQLQLGYFQAHEAAPIAEQSPSPNQNRRCAVSHSLRQWPANGVPRWRKPRSSSPKQRRERQGLVVSKPGKLRQ